MLAVFDFFDLCTEVRGIQSYNTLDAPSRDLGRIGMVERETFVEMVGDVAGGAKMSVRFIDRLHTWDAGISPDLQWRFSTLRTRCKTVNARTELDYASSLSLQSAVLKRYCKAICRGNFIKGRQRWGVNS